MRHPAETPILRAVLRALAFVGLTESVFYRLLPQPVAVGSPSLLDKLHVSLNNAGHLTFLLGFFFSLAALVTIASVSMRRKLWPAGLNGFLSVCFLSLGVLSISAFLMRHGPAFAMGFTLLAIVTLLFMAMHAFSIASSVWEKGLAVTYTSAVLCSALDSLVTFGRELGLLDSPAGAFFRHLAAPALSGGTVLIAAASVFAFMAFCDTGHYGSSPGAPPLWSVVLLSAAPAVAFAAGSLLAPAERALMGPAPEPIAVGLLTAAIFLGSMTAATNLIDKERRILGYGFLLVLLAGFPMRIIHQDLLMVLGAALLFLPRSTATITVRILPASGPLPTRDPLG